MLIRSSFGILLAAMFVTPQAAPRLADPRFESAPCPFAAEPRVLDQVRCGYVSVLENRAKPDGRRLRLAVAILKSRHSTPRADPVVRLGGGPGDPILARVPAVITRGEGGELLDALRDERDVIMYDQRGAGFSEPAFCPEENGNWGLPGGSLTARRERRREIAARCGESMRRSGYDLSQYNSAASALDLQDIRRALGYKEWNVHGHSYGSRLAQVAMRETPEGIRSVLLSGTVGVSVASWYNLPGWTADALSRVFAACDAQPGCRAAFPDLEKTFWRVVDTLERDPMPREVRRPNGRVDTVRVTGAHFAARVHDMMESPRELTMIPLVVHAMAARNEAVLNALLPPAPSQVGPASRGFHFAVQCFEEAPLDTPALKEQARRSHPRVLVDGGLFNDPSVCEGIHPFRAQPSHTAPVESAIPTLIVTGEFDPQTHRSNGPIVQRTLKNSQLVDVPGAGHSGQFASSCMRTLVRDFYNAPREKRDTSCVRAIPPLQFVTDANAIVR